MAPKPAVKKEKRIAWTISGTRPTTLNWFKERAIEADLPFSKYLNLLLDAIKNDAEKNLEGGGGNRTRQLLSDWFATPKDRRVA